MYKLIIYDSPARAYRQQPAMTALYKTFAEAEKAGYAADCNQFDIVKIR